MITLNVNNKNYNVDVDPETPLLWVLRDTLDLAGTKYGCGMWHNAEPVQYTLTGKQLVHV
jgi:aerobic-type carbon monoxide dehydrogenase small subunit (CoxS/CutS family)